jgi:hypothetical protein
MFRHLQRAKESSLPNLLILSALLIGFVILSWLRIWGMRTPLADDAFIFMRFAEHIAGGQGFVWNQGQPPVEGFTSLLYQMLFVGVVILGLSPTALAPWLGIGFNLLALAFIWRLAQWLNPDHPAENVFALVLVSLSPSFVAWTTTGMETPLYNLMLIIGVSSYIAYRGGRIPAWLVGLVYVLVVLTRPEGLAIFGATVLFEVLYRLYQKEKTFFQTGVVMVAAFLIVYSPYFFWRWAYFGYPLPNTYYAKTGDGLIQLQGGLNYLQHTLLFLFGGLAGVLVLALLFVNWRQSPRWNRFYLATVIIVSWISTAINGGDHFPGGRFIVPTLPFLFLLVGMGLTDLFKKTRASSGLKLAVMIILLFLAMAQWVHTGAYDPAVAGWRHLQTGLAPQVPLVKSVEEPIFTDWVMGFVVMGQVLGDIAPPDASIAVVPVGAIGYYSGLQIVDMVGLTDPTIAHQPFDRKYTETWRPGHDKGDGVHVLNQRPDYIQLTDYLTAQPSPGPGELALDYKSIAEIWASPEFHTQYEFYPIKVNGGWYYNLYRRSDVFKTQQPSYTIAEQVGFKEISRRQTRRNFFIQLAWQAQQSISQDYTIFVQLLDAGGQRVAGVDVLPRPGFATLVQDETMLTNHMITLPSDLPPGAYTVLVGLYYFQDETHQDLVNVGQVMLTEPVVIN